MSMPVIRRVVIVSAILSLLGWAAVTAGTTELSYRAEFTDATGVERGDGVRVAGVLVGEVESVRVVRKRVAEVTFSVDRGVRLATSTRVRIRYRNMLGERYLALTEGPGGGRRLAADEVLPLAQTLPALDLSVLFNGFRPLFQALRPADVNTFAYRIVQVFQGESGTVTSLLAHTASLTNALADKDVVIGRVVTNLNTVLGALAERDTELSGLISQLQRLVSGLAADRTAIADSLAGLSSVAGSTASLVRDARPAVKADIAALAQVTGVLAASGSMVGGVLRSLPATLRAATSTAGRGSWVDLYVCGLGNDAAIRPANQGGLCR